MLVENHKWYKHLLIILTIDKLCWFSFLMYVDYISINSVSGFGWSWGILLDTIWQLCCHGTIVRSWAVFEQFCINNQTARFQYVIRTKQRKIVWCFDTVIWWTDRQQTSASPFSNFPRIPHTSNNVWACFGVFAAPHFWGF